MTVLLALGFTSGYLCCSYRHETGLFSGNEIRKMSDIPKQDKAWAIPLELEGVGNFHRVSDYLEPVRSFNPIDFKRLCKRVGVIACYFGSKP